MSKYFHSKQQRKGVLFGEQQEPPIQITINNIQMSLAFDLVAVCGAIESTPQCLMISMVDSLTLKPVPSKSLTRISRFIEILCLCYLFAHLGYCKRPKSPAPQWIADIIYVPTEATDSI